MNFSQTPITSTLIVLNSILYLYLAIIGGSFADIDPRLLVNYGALYSPLVIGRDEWWRLFTAMFLHSNMTHILFNMFALYIIGIGIERNVDRVIYIGMYLFSGLFGSMVSLYVHQNAVGTGASGAIFGIFGLLVAIVIVNRERLGSRSTKMLKEFGVLLVLNIGIGVMFESVDLSAHIAGFLTGLIAGMIVVKKPTLFWWIMLLCIVLLWILARELPTLHIFYNQ